MVTSMLSKTSVYLIRALVVLSELPPDSYVGSASIAEKIGSPQNYLGKMLKMLSQQGIITSQKGYGGGFRLAKEAQNIRLLTIVDSVEQVSKRPHCILGQSVCSEKKPCALHDKWKQIREDYICFLRESTIADLANYYEKIDHRCGLYEKKK